MKTLRLAFIFFVGVALGPAVGTYVASNMFAGPNNFADRWQDYLIFGYAIGCFPAIFWACITGALPHIIKGHTARMAIGPIVGMWSALLPMLFVYVVVGTFSLMTRSPLNLGESVDMTIILAVSGAVAGGTCGLIVEFIWKAD